MTLPEQESAAVMAVALRLYANHDEPVSSDNSNYNESYARKCFDAAEDFMRVAKERHFSPAQILSAAGLRT